MYGVEQVEGDFENFYLLLLDPILECYTSIFGAEGWEGLLSVSKHAIAVTRSIVFESGGQGDRLILSSSTCDLF